MEFRFARTMVSRDAIGVATDDAPVLFTPELPGKFTWLSTRSGVFVPDAAPPLGATYAISTRPELKSADGQPVGADFRATLQTPPFTSFHPTPGDTTEPTPEVHFGYNLAVDLESAGNLFRFVGANGEQISANVRYATGADYSPQKSGQGDWEERWKLARNPATTELSAGAYEAERKKTKRNQLIVTPVSPLTTGTKWEVHLAGGIASANGKYRLRESAIIQLGTVTPFTITALEASSQVHSGRSLNMTFSSDLAPDITAENGSEFFTITPEVKNLRVEPSYSTVTLRGEFQRDQDYQITFDPKLVSSDGQPLDGARSRSVRFDAIKPRLYLPAITSTQIRHGVRKFLVRSVNLQKIQVTARLVSAADLPRAIDAFAAYDKDWDEKNPDESYQPLPPNAVPGRVIKETSFALANPLDFEQTTELDWDEIVGANMAGAIFLTVEGEPREEIGGKHPGAQSLVQLTNLGVLWKKTASGLQANVFSLDTGKAVADANLTLLSEDLAPRPRAVSDGQGAASLFIPEKVAWLLVEQGDDALALRMGYQSDDLRTARFNLPIYYGSWSSEPRTVDMRGLVITDRPLYLPGETVNIKGWLRSPGTNGVASNTTGKLRLRNQKGDQVAELEITSGARGEWDTALTLPTGGVGRHTLSLEVLNGGTFYTSFQVADFQPNAFETTAKLPARLTPNEKLSAQISAKYFFGASLSKAPVRWSLKQVALTEPPDGFEKFELPISNDSPAKSLALHGETTLDEKGTGVIAPQLPETKGAPTKNLLSYEITDLNQQTVSDSRVVVQDSSDYYLGIVRPVSSVFRTDEEIPIQVAAISPGGQPWPEPVKVHAEIIFKRHETVRVQGAGNAISFRTNDTEEIISSADGESLIPQKEADQWTIRTGQTAALKTSKPGDYLVRVKSTDSHGREAVTEWDFYVSGPGETVWDYKNPAQVELIPDKAEYQVGDTAKILVKAPISGEALISIQQRERVLRTERIRLDGNAPTIEVPISELDAPNVFVEMLLIRGTNESTRKFKMPEVRHGICQLNIADPAKSLRVEVAPSQAVAEPGLEMTTEITVRDGKGKPMPGAEVTFFAVDDGILALTAYERPNPAETFAAPWPLNVRTGISISSLVPENPENLVFGNKGYLIGGGGLEGPGVKLRRDFPGTLAWMPSLQCNSDGKVSVKFRVPDALTRYRLVAVAAAQGDYFGSGESSFMIRKPLSLLPAIGSFANVGDEIRARAVVRNDTGADGSVEIALELDATAESAEPLRVSLPVKNGTAASVDFPVRFRAMGKASWQWTAKMSAGDKLHQDGVVSSMEVGSASVLLRETVLTDLSQKTNDLLENINPQLLEGIGTATVTVANTRLASLRESVTQLLEYPYGCSEQTTSALIPWLTISTLRPVLPELAERDEKKGIREGIDKLFSMQTPSGGIAYWPGGQTPSLFSSAYAAVALAQLEGQGTELPPGWEKLLSWLSSELRGTDKKRWEHELSDTALTLYALALAGKAEPAYHEKLFSRRAELSPETRALLALAMVQSGGAPDAIGKLLDPREPAPESFSWFGGAARERAIRLLAWSRFQPKSGEIPRLVNELLASRRNGEWGTTQNNAWALMALSDYFRVVEKGGKDVAGTLLAAGETIPFAVTKTKPAQTHRINFSPEEPPSPLAVENPKKTPLFGETRFVVRPPLANQPRQNRGYAVSRSYQKLGIDGSLSAAENLQVGDRILVTLRLETPQPGHFVAIDDPLPSIFEAVNPAFRSRAVAGADASEDSVSDYRETRKDRVLIFCDHLRAGAFTFQYLARVRSAGTVSAPATKVEEMYRPERFGLGESLSLTSRAAP
jgi:uncharacterized protein YfaS (alpha-2-macroglobulin family)